VSPGWVEPGNRRDPAGPEARNDYVQFIFRGDAMPGNDALGATVDYLQFLLAAAHLVALRYMMYERLMAIPAGREYKAIG